MKILVIGSVYPRFQEDAEVPWLRTSIDHLKKAGAEIEVLAPAYKGLKSHTIDDTIVHRFRYAPRQWEILTHEEGAPSKMANKPWLQLLAIPYIISGFFKCLKICRKWKPDVIHAHWPFPHAYIALGAAKLLKIPLVLNFHGAELLLIRKHKWVKPLLHFAINQAQAIFANSSFTANKIKAIKNVPVEWSPYGTTLNSDNVSSNLMGQNAPSNEIHPINQKFKILFVGRHIERKGICHLIDSANYLDPNKFEIRIVGEGDLTSQLKEQAAKLSTGTCPVVFTGKLSPKDLENEYKTANAFVLPAIVDHKGDTEGLGVVLIEAMELGLPIVASNVGGIPDVVINNETGILVPEKDSKALAEAFMRLEESPKLIHCLLNGSRKRIQECFSWDGIIQRQIDIYNKLTP